MVVLVLRFCICAINEGTHFGSPCFSTVRSAIHPLSCQFWISSANNSSYSAFSFVLGYPPIPEPIMGVVGSPLSFHTQDNSLKLSSASQRTLSPSVFSMTSPLSLVETDTCLWGRMGGYSAGAGVAVKAANIPLSWPVITVANTFASYCSP